MWRPADEALLQRIEDELLIEALWRNEAPGAPPLHPRAAGVCAALRQTSRGRQSVQAAVAAVDDQERLRAVVRWDDHRGLSPRAKHHLAIFHARAAAAHGAKAPPDLRARSKAEVRSLAAWIALADEQHYLQSLADAVAGDLEPDVGMALLQRRIAALGDRARAGAGTLDAAGHAAMRVLARVSEACRRSGCSVEKQKRIEAEAARERERVVEEALSPVTAAIADANARTAIEREGGALMQRVVAVWNWSDWDEHVERYAVDEATPLAWNVYQTESAFDALRGFITPLEPLVDNLARRIEDDPSRLAYAAPVAQMYVFRSEMATQLEEQLRWAERAVALCPTHRNGRLILARLLCWEVRGKLDQGISANLEKAKLIATLDRAEQLYPRTTGIDGLRERIDNMRWWRGG